MKKQNFYVCSWLKLIALTVIVAFLWHDMALAREPSTKPLSCGINALHRLFLMQGINIPQEELAIIAVTIDNINGTPAPKSSYGRLANSLYALYKTADYYGLRFYPAKINLSDKTSLKELVNFTPFIAHFSSQDTIPIGHFVLVSNIDEESVYFYDKGNTSLTHEEFSKQFTGYALISNISPLSSLLSTLYFQTMRPKGY